MSRFSLRLALALTCPSLLLAAAPVPPAALMPGAWSFTNTPGAATLDGRPLHDLPVGEASSEAVCLSPEDAIDPARWLARDLAGDCVLTRRTLAAGRVDIAGRCAPRDEGQAAGSLTITGRYTPTRYDLRFATLAHGENGEMRFSGRMRGRRIGACPAG